MSGSEWAAIIAALGGPATVVALYKWARAQGRADALAEQSRKTMDAKNAEVTELQAENRRLWALLDHLTGPPEGRS